MWHPQKNTQQAAHLLHTEKTKACPLSEAHTKHKHTHNDTSL